MHYRQFKKFYLVAIFLFGLFFWALVKNGLPEITPMDKMGKEINFNSLISNQLNSLEGEIEAQKVYGSVLLNKIKAKFSAQALEKSNGEKPMNEFKGENNIDFDIESDVHREREEAKEKKLQALQKELLEADHKGEVKSEGEGPAQSRENAKEENGDDEQQRLVPGESVIAVLVFVCNRPSVQRALDSLFKYRPSGDRFPIIVSQDCGNHAATTSVLKSYKDKIIHIQQPDLSEIQVPLKEKKLKGYFNIARHYGWALNHTFNVFNYSNVLIVEDDLEVAPDFFEYFSATLPILRKDPNLWCVSAWNDNGKPKRINGSAPELLHRTDFFPGLGWMLTKDIWKELMVKWPRSYWDDWMRETAQRRERACIRPEISRTSTFGKNGVSHGTYFQNHLRFIKLNDRFVPFTSLDLSYLDKDEYDVEFVRKVYSSQLVNSVDDLIKVSGDSSLNSELRLTYRTKNEFRIIAKKLELMEDFRSGVPRTAYRGVVPFMFNNKRVYLAPGANWVAYTPN